MQIGSPSLNRGRPAPRLPEVTTVVAPVIQPVTAIEAPVLIAPVAPVVEAVTYRPPTAPPSVAPPPRSTEPAAPPADTAGSYGSSAGQDSLADRYRDTLAPAAERAPWVTFGDAAIGRDSEADAARPDRDAILAAALAPLLAQAIDAKRVLKLLDG